MAFNRTLDTLSQHEKGTTAVPVHFIPEPIEIDSDDSYLEQGEGCPIRSSRCRFFSFNGMPSGTSRQMLRLTQFSNGSQVF